MDTCCVLGPFENPPESRDGGRPEPVKAEEQKPPPTQEEINMLIDEEMSLFPEQKFVYHFSYQLIFSLQSVVSSTQVPACV